MRPRAGRHALAFVFITVLIDMIGFGSAKDAALYFPGAAFFAAGLLVLGAMLVFAWVTTTRPAPAAASTGAGA